MAKRAGVGDQALHLIVGNAELFRHAERQRGARAADVDGTHCQRHRTVLADVEVGAGLAAEVEPETAGHAAALVGAERRRHVRMLPGRLQRGPDADGPIDRAIGRLGPLLGGVLDANLEASMPILWASSSTTLSTAKAAMGAEGAR